MRTRVVIFCLFILAAACLLLWFHRPAGQPINDLHEAEPVVANGLNHPAESQTVAVSKPAVSAVPSTTNPPAQGRQPLTPEDIYHGYDEWRVPINFYGKVLDENENPVPGVSVSFGWTDLSPQGHSSASTASDASGLFALEGQTGKHLSVSIVKDGYYTSRSNLDSFFFSGKNENFTPNRNVPVLFHLRKKGKGEALISTAIPGFTGIVQLHHDGTPVELDLLKGAQVSAGGGQLKLELWRDLSNPNARIFDWKLQMSAPGGGLISTDEEFAFQAPAGGYQPAVVIDMPATNLNWQGEVRSKYYIQLPDGKYGRIDFYFLSFNGVFTVQSAINPTGSRNLEPQ